MTVIADQAGRFSEFYEFKTIAPGPKPWFFNDDTIDNPEDYAPYCRWTRHRPAYIPAGTSKTSDEIRGFGPDLKNWVISVHEAAHAVMHLVRGTEVKYVFIGKDDGHVRYVIDSQPFRNEAAAAGERAEGRWLHESGLWNEDRAWIAERVAWMDRRDIEEFNGGKLTFGTDPYSPTDLIQIHAATDVLLDHSWDRVMKLAAHLTENPYVTGDEAAAVTGLTNHKYRANR